jgi:hypothetical protein
MATETTFRRKTLSDLPVNLLKAADPERETIAKDPKLALYDDAFQTFFKVVFLACEILHKNGLKAGTKVDAQIEGALKQALKSLSSSCDLTCLLAHSYIYDHIKREGSIKNGAQFFNGDRENCAQIAEIVSKSVTVLHSKEIQGLSPGSLKLSAVQDCTFLLREVLAGEIKPFHPQPKDLCKFLRVFGVESTEKKS